MPDITVGDTSYALDEKGYLIDFASWNSELAAALAAADGIAALGPVLLDTAVAEGLTDAAVGEDHGCAR